MELAEEESSSQVKDDEYAANDFTDTNAMASPSKTTDDT